MAEETLDFPENLAMAPVLNEQPDIVRVEAPQMKTGQRRRQRRGSIRRGAEAFQRFHDRAPRHAFPQSANILPALLHERLIVSHPRDGVSELRNVFRLDNQTKLLPRHQIAQIIAAG